jgi:hypothetical protein
MRILSPQRPGRLVAAGVLAAEFSNPAVIAEPRPPWREFPAGGSAPSAGRAAERLLPGRVIGMFAQAKAVLH